MCCHYEFEHHITDADEDCGLGECPSALANPDAVDAHEGLGLPHNPLEPTK